MYVLIYRKLIKLCFGRSDKFMGYAMLYDVPHIHFAHFIATERRKQHT